jgi:radical SAM superfamily enzyme YgiQ (UPF0313 family)
MRLLLINPRFPESFWSLKWVVDTVMPGVRTVNPPLGLATLAALCPPHWQVEIVDENTRSAPLDPQADIIGVCGMGVQFPRQRELLEYYRARGHFVVAGGSYASLCPEALAPLADTVVAGEAEYVWADFCRDFEAGSPRALYHETGTVSLADSPAPRFDLLDIGRYSAVSMQFSRGCPFRCEFCDIIVMFGRHPRTKSVEQIGAELDRLRRLGVHDVFFVDDNLIGDRGRAKGLLRFLRDYQREHGYRFRFGTEASLNLARDDELMRLFNEANFEWVFIGIESPDEASLKETKKFQNTAGDILDSVRAIYARGIDVHAGFIIGFDNDTVETFEKQYRFIVDSGIQMAMIGLLMAIEKTPLYERLEREGRLRPSAFGADNSKLATNIVPKGMTYDELVGGYQRLYRRLLEPPAIAARVRNKARHFRGSIYGRRRPPREALGILGKVLRRVVAESGARGLYHVFRSLPLTRPRLLPLAVHDWVVGISMRDYVQRHFHREFEADHRRVRRHMEAIQRGLQRYLRQGSLRVSFLESQHGPATVSLAITGELGKDFFARATRQIEGVLRETRASVTLRIEEFHASESEMLHRLLQRLRRYGARVRVAADERSRRIIAVDSSIFNVSMEPRAPARTP